jgi:hypothetical protein
MICQHTNHPAAMSMTQQSTGIDENDDGDLKDTTINQQLHNNQPAATQQSTGSDDHTTINQQHPTATMTTNMTTRQQVCPGGCGSLFNLVFFTF